MSGTESVGPGVRPEVGPGFGAGAGPGAESGAGPGAGPGAESGADADRGLMRVQFAWLAGGVLAVVAATVLGGAGALGPLLEPPFPVGLLLGAAAALLAVVVLLRAAARIGPARGDARQLIRAVRLVFVAVGLFAAAGGWLVGSALPIVVGLVIVGIDVVETSFLLLVTAARGTEVEGDAVERDVPERDAAPR